MVKGDQLNMAVFFWYPEKSDLSNVQRVKKRTLEKSLFTRYQKKTPMFNWLPCTLANSNYHNHLSVVGELSVGHRVRRLRDDEARLGAEDRVDGRGGRGVGVERGRKHEPTPATLVVIHG